MTVDIHPGNVVHSMDHLVLDLATSDGSSAYLTIYSLALMRDVGPGRVALLRITRGDDVVDRCFGETIGLAARMQQRLRKARADGGNAPEVGITNPPIQASIRRTPTSAHGEHWMVESSENTIEASWSSPEPPIWLSAPAPSFHATRDYFTTMVSYRDSELVVDGHKVAGDPYPHALWEERLGRPFSSCHAAFAETAVERP